MAVLGKLATIGRTYRHLSRYQHILRVLVKYGFGDLLDRFHIRRYMDAVVRLVLHRKPHPEAAQLSTPQRLRRVLEELGPTFIKLGQVLSTRPDILPARYLDELTHLQDHVPPFPYENVVKIITQDFGSPPDELFAEFDPEPIAAASIAQGHRARLHDGREVFVKVRRPRIGSTVAVDLEILEHLASMVERHATSLSMVQPTRLVQEFRRTLQQELDFEVECANLSRFQRQFEGREGIYIPEVFEEFSSTRVLTMEFIRGIKASNIEELRAAGCDLKQLAKLGADLLLEQFFVHGFFHADLHPGNIRVLPPDRYCYLDFGMVGRLSRRERETLGDLITGAVAQDERRLVEPVLAMTVADADVDTHELECDLAELTESHLHLSLNELNVARVFQDLYAICHRHHLCFRPHIYLLAKAVGTVEEMGRLYDPDFQMAEHLAPFVKRLAWERYRPSKLLHEAASGTAHVLRLFRELPENARAIMTQLRRGKMKVEFEHRGLEDMLHRHEHIASRVSSAIILAALIVGSSLMTVSDIPPKWNGIPLIGIVGFVGAAMLGLVLLWDIWKSSRE
jgi:ubiquinone biosynthesis protein